MNNYQQQCEVALNCTFTDATGVLVDPTAVTVEIRLPDKTLATYTPDQLSTGVYSYNLVTTLPGVYSYRFVGTGAVIAANEAKLNVIPSNVVCCTP